MRYAVVAHLLLFSSVAFGGDKPASCELVGKSVLGRSSSGLVQLSNSGIIEIECRVPVRPLPGRGFYGLKVATVAYQISPDGDKTPVPSELNQTGGGYDAESVSVYFDAHIPLEAKERDDLARRFMARIEKSMAPEQITEEGHQRMLERVRELVNPERVGHFRLECRVLDGDHVIGVGVVEFEVLLKVRVSDFFPPS
jgi:hypothetical protein